MRNTVHLVSGILRHIHISHRFVFVFLGLKNLGCDSSDYCNSDAGVMMGLGEVKLGVVSKM